MHQEVPALRGADQATDRGLPLVELLIGLRKLVDVNAGIQQGDELATARQRYRIVKRSFSSPLFYAERCARSR
jgi:hypothetical protein